MPSNNPLELSALGNAIVIIRFISTHVSMTTAEKFIVRPGRVEDCDEVHRLIKVNIIYLCCFNHRSVIITEIGSNQSFRNKPLANKASRRTNQNTNSVDVKNR